MSDHSPRFVVVIAREPYRGYVTVAAGSIEACLAALRLWPGGTIAVERKTPP